MPREAGAPAIDRGLGAHGTAARAGGDLADLEPAAHQRFARRGRVDAQPAIDGAPQVAEQVASGAVAIGVGGGDALARDAGTHRLERLPRAQRHVLAGAEQAGGLRGIGRFGDRGQIAPRGGVLPARRGGFGAQQLAFEGLRRRAPH
jgi:hypothetical protein